MVLGIIGAIAGATAMPMGAAALPNAATSTATSAVGVSQGSMNSNGGNQGQQKSQPDPNDPRLAKFTLKAHCDSESPSRKEVHKKQVVLRKGKLYLDSSSHPRFEDGHPFSGFFLEYPSGDKSRRGPRGLVSTISKDPPELNWIYVDKDTLELRYGGKSETTGQIVGPWDWTDDQKGILLESWEGFVAMEEQEGGETGWVLCYDRDDDHMKRMRGNKRVVEIELDRRIITK